MPRMDENGHLKSANFRMQKRSSETPLNFSTKDLVLKRAKIKSIVYLPLTCAIVASLLRCR